MKILCYGLLIGWLLFPLAVNSCPNCFGASEKDVLHTYYFSAILLSLLPFGIVTVLSIWITRNHRKTEHAGGAAHPRIES
jgi:hypothetical protein